MSTGKKYDYIPTVKSYSTSYGRSYGNYGGYYGGSYGSWKDEDFYNDYKSSNTKKNLNKKDICIFCEFCRLETCVDCPFVKEKEESSDKDEKGLTVTN